MRKLNCLVLSPAWIRSQSLVLLLFALLQRTPVIQHIAAAEFSAPGKMAQVLKWAIASVTGLGAYNTLAGQSRIDQNPVGSIEVEAGKELTLVLQVLGTPAPPQSIGLSSSLPPGLDLFVGLVSSTPVDPVPFKNLNGPGEFGQRAFVVKGVPSEPGAYQITFTAWRFSNGSGNLLTRTVNITILSPSEPSSIFSDLPDLGGGLKSLGSNNNFGFFTEVAYPWLFHFDHGFLYTVATDRSSMWFYDLNAATWWWTSEAFDAPYKYFADVSAWYLYIGKSEGGGRLFFDFTNPDDITITERNP